MKIVIQGNREITGYHNKWNKWQEFVTLIIISIIITIAEKPYSTPGSCDFEKGHGLCGYQRVSDVDQFNWTFGSRQLYSFPKTDHTTFDTDGEGTV